MNLGTLASDRRALLALACVLLLATVLRVGWPTLTEFKFSEARLEALALELTQNGRLPLVGVPSSAGFDHSPVSVYLYVPAFLLTSNPIPATIYGGLVGVAAVALTWWLARRWPGGGPWAAGVAGLLFAANPWSVAFSRKIWQVAFVPLLALAFVGFLIAALIEQPASPSRIPARKADRGNATKRQPWSLAWGLVVYALLVQVHPSAVSLAPAVLLWLIVFRRRVRLGPLLAGGALGLLTAVPFIVNQVQSGWPAVAAFRALPEAKWDLVALTLAWQSVTGQGIHALAGEDYPLLRMVPQLGRVFGLIGYLALVATFGLAWRSIVGWRSPQAQRRLAARVDLVLLSWLAVPVAFNLRHSLELHLHFFALVAPAAFLLVGRAAEVLCGQAVPEIKGAARQRTGVRALKTFCLGGLGLLVAVQITALMLMGRFVATHDTPGGFGTPLKRYLDLAEQVVLTAAEERAGEVLVVGKGDSPVVDEIPAIFDVLLRGHVDHRFADGESAAVFPDHRAVALVAPRAGAATLWYDSFPARDLQGGYRLVLLDASWPQVGLETLTGARTFQNGVEVQGYTWELDADPGEQMRFWLLWQVLWQAPEASHFYVHVLDAQDQLWGQVDTPGYPTIYRSRGDRIISKFDITKANKAADGVQRVRVGLYSYPQVISIPVIDGLGNPLGDALVLDPPKLSH